MKHKTSSQIIHSMEKLFAIQFHAKKNCFCYFHKNFVEKSMTKTWLFHSQLWEKMLSIKISSIKNMIIVWFLYYVFWSMKLYEIG